MNLNSQVIIAMCSHLCRGDDIVPLEPGEWAKLSSAISCPHELLSFEESDFKKLGLEFERCKKLLNRMPSLMFECQKYSNIGIKIVTLADSDYPSKLKNAFNEKSSPLFYYAGDLSVAENTNFIGIVGSRDVKENDIAFTKKLSKT